MKEINQATTENIQDYSNLLSKISDLVNRTGTKQAATLNFEDKLPEIDTETALRAFERVKEENYNLGYLYCLVGNVGKPKYIERILEECFDQITLLITWHEVADSGLVTPDFHHFLYIIQELKYCFRYMHENKI